MANHVLSKSSSHSCASMRPRHAVQTACAGRCLFWTAEGPAGHMAAVTSACLPCRCKREQAVSHAQSRCADWAV